MNEMERNNIRDMAMAGADDIQAQLEWNKESLGEHLRIEQRLKAKFRLADFSGDVQAIAQIGKQIQDVRAAIQYLNSEIERLSRETT